MCATLRPLARPAALLAAAALSHATLAATATAQQPRVLLNEFLAKNDSGLQDEAGEFDDWLEIVNATTVPVTVSGMYLSDRPTDLTKWQIPPGFVLQPGAHLLVWADEDQTQGLLHANFRLAAGGEFLLLVDTDGTTILDQISFGPQLGDVSTGRYADAGVLWVTFPEPTPARTNRGNSCGSRRYSGLDPTRLTVGLDLGGTPGVGQTVALQIRGGPPSAPVVLAFGTTATHRDLAPLTPVPLLVAPPPFISPTFNSDANGDIDVALSIPNVPSLSGATVVFQAWSAAGQTLAASNGLEVRVCP